MSEKEKETHFNDVTNCLLTYYSGCAISEIRIISHSAKINMEAAAAALSKPQIIVHVEKSLNYTVFDAKWVPCSAKFVVVGSHPRDTGALEVYELSKGELKTVLKVIKL